MLQQSRLRRSCDCCWWFKWSWRRGSLSNFNFRFKLVLSHLDCGADARNGIWSLQNTQRLCTCTGFVVCTLCVFSGASVSVWGFDLGFLNRCRSFYQSVPTQSGPPGGKILSGLWFSIRVGLSVQPEGASGIVNDTLQLQADATPRV